MWVFDVIVPLSEIGIEAKKKKSFILITTKWYTKWAKIEAFAEIKSSTIVKFIMRNIITQFGISNLIIIDNGPQFISQELKEMCNMYVIQLHHSLLYYS